MTKKTGGSDSNMDELMDRAIKEIMGEVKTNPIKQIISTSYLAIAIENLINETKTSEDVHELKEEIKKQYKLDKYKVEDKFEKIAQKYQKKLKRTQRIKEAFQLDEALEPKSKQNIDQIECLVCELLDLDYDKLNYMKRKKLFHEMIVQPYEQIIGLYVSEKNILNKRGRKPKRPKMIVQGLAIFDVESFSFYGNKEVLKNKELEKKVEEHEFKHLIDKDIIETKAYHSHSSELCAYLYSKDNPERGFERDKEIIEKKAQDFKDISKTIRIQDPIEQEVEKRKNYLIENKERILELANLSLYLDRDGFAEPYSTMNPRVLSHIIALTPTLDLIKTMEHCIYKPIIIDNPVKNRKY